MEDPPANQFGKRRPRVIPPRGSQPVKRSRHVALLLMGSLVVGGGAFAMMPGDNCEPKGGGMAGPTLPHGASECSPRRSSSSGGYGGSGGSWSRSSFFSGDSTSSRSSTGNSSEPGSAETTRGGFGGFARSFAAHFSGS